MTKMSQWVLLNCCDKIFRKHKTYKLNFRKKHSVDLIKMLDRLIGV